MTISEDDDLRVQQTGNGSATTISYPKPVNSDEELIVYELDTDTDIVTTLVLDTDYTVTGSPSGGPYPDGVTITLLGGAPAATITHTVIRDTTRSQESAFDTASAFPANVMEQALDKIVMIAQENTDSLNRTLKFPASITTAFSDELPLPEEGKALIWGADGVIENSEDDFGSVAADAAASAAAAAASAVDAANYAESALDISLVPIASLAANPLKEMRVNAAGDELEFFSQEEAVAAVYGHDTGGDDTYAVTLSPAPSSYVAGMVVRMLVDTGNTGAATLNVNGLGAKNIYKHPTVGAVSGTLATGDIVASQVVTLVYDGTQFQLQSPTFTRQSLRAFTLLTSGTSHTFNQRTKYSYIELVGGGGGGGAASSDAKVGGGGGAGGYCLVVDTYGLGSTITYAIGAAGAASSGAAGGDGGNTTFDGGYYIAAGGTGGAANGGSFAAGGTATHGYENRTGQNGGGGGSNTTSANGTGASSPFGRGGFHGIPGSGGQAASGYGAGGGGGHRDTTTTRQGGAGTQGCIRIWEFG